MSKTNMDLNEMWGGIAAHDTAVICTHVNPDGDAFGSSLGLAMTLRKLGKNVRVLLGELPQKFSFLKGRELIGDAAGLSESFKDCAFICLDSSGLDRLGANEELFRQARSTWCLDHHISNAGFARHNHIDPEASSCSELVYRLTRGSGLIDADIAAALYTGILTDTAGFRHKSASPATMRAAADLMEQGIDFGMIYREMMCLHSQAEARLLSLAVSKMKLSAGGRICSSLIDTDDFASIGASPEDMEGIVEYLLNVRGAEASALFSQRDEGAKASLRSLETDVCAVAALFGGGGHKYAAGISSKLDVRELEEAVVSALADSIEE